MKGERLTSPQQKLKQSALAWTGDYVIKDRIVV